MDSQLKYSEIESIATRLSSNASKMGEKLQEITQLFNVVGSDKWSGDAASEIRAKLDSISSKFHEFNEAVQSEADYLNGVVANYKAADAAAQAMMQ